MFKGDYNVRYTFKTIPLSLEICRDICTVFQNYILNLRLEKKDLKKLLN